MSVRDLTLLRKDVNQQSQNPQQADASIAEFLQETSLDPSIFEEPLNMHTHGRCTETIAAWYSICATIIIIRAT